MYIKKKYRELLAKADKQFTIPKSFQKFIDKYKRTHNLIIKSKCNQCYCTNCSYKFVAQANANTKIICPYCRERLLVKTDRLKNYIFKDNLQLLDKIDNIFILRTFELYTSYNKDKMESHITEFMRTIIEKDEVNDFTSNQVCNHMGYMYIHHYSSFTHWKKRNFRWAYRDVMGIVSPYNIKSLLQNTELRFSMLDRYIAHMDYINFIQCLKLARYPSFEMLIKMKLYNLASEADQFTKGKNFQEIFGLPKIYYPFMKKHNINIRQLQVLKLLQKKDIKLINKLVNYNNLEELSKYVKLEDAYYKVLKKNKFHEHEYLDYLRMNALLERDLKDKRILFPKNLIEEHDKLVKLIKLVEDEQNDKLIKLRLKKLNKNIFQNEKYIVFPAPSIESLQKEANSQKNCLLLYCKKYALGECDIFFLRKRKNIDESLVTIEIRNSKIIQARSKYNEPINKEQEKFLNTWAKKVLLKEAVKNA